MKGTIRGAHHQFVGNLGDDRAEGEDVETGMMLKQLAGGLLKDDEGQGEDEADVQARRQHARVLWRLRLLKNSALLSMECQRGFFFFLLS